MTNAPASPTPHTTQRFPERIVVTGAHGQLGRQLCRLLGPRAIPVDIDTLDLTDAAQVGGWLDQVRPQLLINTAAYTAVDAAEHDAARCWAVNRDAVSTLVEITQRLDCPLLQLSTDYVFAGSDRTGPPFRESDPVVPLGVYARSKAAAEAVVSAHPQHLIVRTCGLYGPHAETGSGNFVNTMLRLGRQRPSIRVVNDQVCCPTYVVELAEALVYLVGAGQRGLFHVVNREALSWYELARETFRLAGLNCEVIPITTAEYGAPAPRPRYSALDVSKYLNCGGPPLATCKQALARYLASREAS
jgi:dTDP-4-dehydrorhamnose reductase